MTASAHSRLPPGRSPELHRRIAVHEAGHALIAKIYASRVSATILPGPGWAGRVWDADYHQQMNWTDTDLEPKNVDAIVEKLMPKIGASRIPDADQLLAIHQNICGLLAGPIAEEILLPDQPPMPSDHDFQEARLLAMLVVSNASSVGSYIAFQRIEAETLIRDHREVVWAIADALMEKGTIHSEEIDQVIGQAVATKALADARANRASWNAVLASAATFKSN